MKKSRTKEFDAVQKMREIREALNQETQEMSYEEQRQYIREHLEPRTDNERQTRG